MAITLLVLGALAAHAPSAAAQRRVRLESPLTLERAIVVARSNRREIDAAGALADAADERPRVVNRPPDPMVMASLDHLPLEQIMGADWSVAVRQDFPLSDVLGARARTAEAAARRLRWDVERAALDVDLEVAMAYLELFFVRRLEVLLGGQLALAEQLVAASEARYAAAVGSQTDVLRAATERARIEALQRALDARIAGATGMLVAALGLPPRSRIPALAPPEDAMTDASVRALVARARGARPELAAGREAIARARGEVSVMEQMYFPMASVQVGGAYTMAEGGGVMAMFGVSVPIFRSRLGAGVDEARAMERMAAADLAAMERMVEGEVASAIGMLRAARIRRDALRNEVLPRALQAVDSALAQYGAAQVAQVTVVEAMRALFSIEIEALEAEVETGMAAARLERALGGPS